MINLPSNWLKRAVIRELPHDPSFAILLLRFKNEHDQVFNWFQVLQAKHGMSAASLLESGLSLLTHIDFPNEQPYTNGKLRIKAEALDQKWEQDPIANTINLKDFRVKHGLRDPEEVHRA